MGLRELPEELLELILGFVRDPRTAAVSREWKRAYEAARTGWQAFYCRHGFTNHYGGYVRRCSGCWPVTFDYLRVMRDVDRDILRPWPIHTGTLVWNPRAVSPQTQRVPDGHSNFARPPPQKRARANQTHQDAEPS